MSQVSITHVCFEHPPLWLVPGFTCIYIGEQPNVTGYRPIRFITLEDLHKSWKGYDLELIGLFTFNQLQPVWSDSRECDVEIVKSFISHPWKVISRQGLRHYCLNHFTQKGQEEECVLDVVRYLPLAVQLFVHGEVTNLSSIKGWIEMMNDSEVDEYHKRCLVEGIMHAVPIVK